jgi:hypothetical protein
MTNGVGRVEARAGSFEPPHVSDPAREPMSPELVLVDPELRSQLLQTGLDDVAGFQEPAVPSAGESLEALPAPEPAGESPRNRMRWTQLTAAVLCGSIATICVGVAAGVRWSGTSSTSPAAATARPAELTTAPASQAAAARAEQRPTERVADRPRPTALLPPSGRAATRAAPAATAAKHSAKARASTARGGAAVQRFTWAPVSGATAYDVAFYRGTVPVFNARTQAPTIAIRVRGAASRLPPGTYRWYVWPVRRGKVDRVAVVNSTLVIPRR